MTEDPSITVKKYRRPPNFIDEAVRYIGEYNQDVLRKWGTVLEYDPVLRQCRVFVPSEQNPWIDLPVGHYIVKPEGSSTFEVYSEDAFWDTHTCYLDD